MSIWFYRPSGRQRRPRNPFLWRCLLVTKPTRKPSRIRSALSNWKLCRHETVSVFVPQLGQCFVENCSSGKHSAKRLCLVELVQTRRLWLWIGAVRSQRRIPAALAQKFCIEKSQCDVAKPMRLWFLISAYQRCRFVAISFVGLLKFGTIRELGKIHRSQMIQRRSSAPRSSARGVKIRPVFRPSSLKMLFLRRRGPKAQFMVLDYTAARSAKKWNILDGERIEAHTFLKRVSQGASNCQVQREIDGSFLLSYNGRIAPLVVCV